MGFKFPLREIDTASQTPASQPAVRGPSSSPGSKSVSASGLFCKNNNNAASPSSFAGPVRKMPIVVRGLGKVKEVMCGCS